MDYPFSNRLKTPFVNLIRSILHDIVVAIVGFGFALIGTRLDSHLGITEFYSPFTIIMAWILLIMGFLLRIWATFHFYKQHLKVISLVPQKKLITTGPYRFSRNPLYLGGNVFIFLGAVLFFGSPTGLYLTAINILLVNLWIRREEKQLEHYLGEEWIRYKDRVRRWL